MEKLAVIGAGSWGTTAAALAARSTDTVVWARRGDLAQQINQTRENSDYLPGVELPERLAATHDIAACVEGAGAVAIAVPSHAFRSIFSEVAAAVGSHIPIISLTKGIEQGTLARMTEVIAELKPDTPGALIGVLTGPNLAAEISAGQPTAAVVALPLATARAQSDDAAVRYLPSDQVRAAFARGVPMIEVGDYKIHASRREGPGQAEIHTRDTDIAYILQGSATLVTGGSAVGVTETGPEELRVDMPVRAVFRALRFSHTPREVMAPMFVPARDGA